MYVYKDTAPVSFYHRSKWIDWAESGYCCWRTSWIWSTAAQMLLEAKVHWCIGCWSEWGSLTYRCAGGQQHYHLWWSRNLAIWAAPRHYLVDLDGEKDQAVKKMETPSTSPGPLVPTCWTQEIYSIWVDINFSLRLCWRMKVVSPKILFIRLGIVHLVSSECLQKWSSI